mmetsp:Transcript_28647/g.82962  ORF Transcript_28647/g.82962 Transcript_28647/m.82962 type:complete len:517 (-) Transcript_28647:22-1572(-)
MLVGDGDEGSLLVGGSLAPADPVRAVGDEGHDGGHGDGNAGDGPGRELVGAGIEEGLDRALVLDVAAVGGLLLTELRDHGGLAAVLLDVVLAVVDVGGEVGVEVVEFDVVLHADGLEETLEKLLPIINGLSVGGVVHEVRGQSAGLDGQLELDVRDIVVVELVLVNIEKLEEVGKALVVVAVGDDELSVGNGLLNLNMERKVLDGLVVLLDLLEVDADGLVRVLAVHEDVLDQIALHLLGGVFLGGVFVGIALLVVVVVVFGILLLLVILEPPAAGTAPAQVGKAVREVVELGKGVAILDAEGLGELLVVGHDVGEVLVLVLLLLLLVLILALVLILGLFGLDAQRLGQALHLVEDGGLGLFGGLLLVSVLPFVLIFETAVAAIALLVILVVLLLLGIGVVGIVFLNGLGLDVVVGGLGVPLDPVGLDLAGVGVGRHGGEALAGGRGGGTLAQEGDAGSEGKGGGGELHILLLLLLLGSRRKYCCCSCFIAIGEGLVRLVAVIGFCCCCCCGGGGD